MKLFLAILLGSLAYACSQRQGPDGRYGPRKEDGRYPDWNGDGRYPEWKEGGIYPEWKGDGRYPEWKEGSRYADRYDGMNIDEMLANKRLVNAYIKCLDNSGKCTSDGRYLKEQISDALSSGCKKCTEDQQKGVRKVIRYLVNNEGQAWDRLVKLYDSKGEYSQKYSNELKALQG